MDSAKLNDWMQVIGIFAVVASLLFVGLQMKQSQEIALAEQYQARADAAQAMYLSVLESGVSWESLDVPMQEKSPDERNLAVRGGKHWCGDRVEQRDHVDPGLRAPAG